MVLLTRTPASTSHATSFQGRDPPSGRNTDCFTRAHAGKPDLPASVSDERLYGEGSPDTDVCPADKLHPSTRCRPSITALGVPVKSARCPPDLAPLTRAKSLSPASHSSVYSTTKAGPSTKAHRAPA